MIDLECPNCKCLITVADGLRKSVYCTKCLESSGKAYIMVESNQILKKPRNLGGGLFEMPKE
jgi:hypothetical protein